MQRYNFLMNNKHCIINNLNKNNVKLYANRYNYTENNVIYMWSHIVIL